MLDERCPRDGTMLKLSVNSGVSTVDMWVCLDETGPVFSGRDSEWSNHFRQAFKTGRIV